MNETLSTTITTERVDDVPLPLAQMERMGLPLLLDAHFPPHNNHQWLSLSWLCTVWFAHILSQADHRLNRMRPWADQLQEALAAFLPAPLRPIALTDDRRADGLRILRDDPRWRAFEGAHTGHLIHVYDLRPTTVRVDSTTASGYWDVTDAGRFPFRHSTDRRPDLPQLNMMLATLDPLGRPVAADVAAGQRADDRRSLPITARVRASLGQTSLWSIGDSKLSGPLKRATIHQMSQHYRGPLGAIQLPAADRAALVEAVLETVPVARLLCTATHPQPAAGLMTAIMHSDADGHLRWIADATEQTVTRTAMLDGDAVTWPERQVLVRSRAIASAQERALQQRLAQAKAALANLQAPRQGKPRPTTPEALEAAVTVILIRYEVDGILTVTTTAIAHTHRRRADKDRPAQEVAIYDLTLTSTIVQPTYDATVAGPGWRVYVTNRPVDALSLDQAVLAYRNEYLVKRSLERLKGVPLSLSPVYLSRDDHTTGLLHLLTIGMRVLTGLETAIRDQLAQEQAALVGLYADQTTRTTVRPTTERVLEAFRHLTLTMVTLPEQSIRHLTPLSALQQR
ncbi:MAG: hypothetical protein MI924_34195, partial [Chloroflexales bacterium]|nr:hypothetical protein [Chloroflexales bacterium]